MILLSLKQYLLKKGTFGILSNINHILILTLVIVKVIMSKNETIQTHLTSVSKLILNPQMLNLLIMNVEISH